MSRRRFWAASGHRAVALAELIIAIGALAVVSIVVMQLFVSAARWENRARDLDKACFESQSVIELYKLYGAPVDPSGVWGRPVNHAGSGVWEIHYDSEWRPAGARPDKGFTLSLSLSVTPDNGLIRLDVTVTRYDPLAAGTEGETVFTLMDSVYTWEEGIII